MDFLDIIKILSPVLSVIGGVITFILKVRSDTQIRTLRIIQDELNKIDIWCIELLEKYIYIRHHSNMDNIIREEYIVEIKILSHKIDYHLDYLEKRIEYFPYGIMDSLHKEKDVNEYFRQQANALFFYYQNSICNETIFERGQQFFDENNLLYTKKNERIINYKHDDVIANGQDLLKYFEEHITSEKINIIKHTLKFYKYLIILMILIILIFILLILIFIA